MTMTGADRGILVIISSPSGAGKTTLSRRLLDEFPQIQFSVSYTTRPKRGNEQDGRDYHFVDDATFDRMIEEDAFAEWAVVHGNRYGTSRAAVEGALVGGRDVVFDVDYQGGRVLSDKWPNDSLKIFILPPDLATLESRLRRRATDSEDVIQRRLRKALEELEYHRDYHHKIVNDDLNEAYANLRAIYLVRRYGPVNRPDVDYPLAELAARVKTNDASGASSHAAALIAAGRTTASQS